MLVSTPGTKIEGIVLFDRAKIGGFCSLIVHYLSKNGLF